MLTKFFRIVSFCIIIFYHNILYSKNLDPKNFNEKNVSNYFSALVSLNNNQNNDSLKFFNSSKFLKESHELYLKKYLFSLVLIFSKIFRICISINLCIVKNSLH